MEIRRKTEILLCACLAVSTAVNGYLVYRRNPRPAESLPAGAQFPSLSGSKIVTAELPSAAASRRRVYYWFSPTCPFCKRNEESVEQLARRLPKGEFVGISPDSAELKTYVNDHHIEFPVAAVPANSQVITKLGPTPTTFVVNAKGVIETIWVGAFVDPVKTEIEHFFGLPLPNLQASQSPGAVVRKAVPRQ